MSDPKWLAQLCGVSFDLNKVAAIGPMSLDTETYGHSIVYSNVHLLGNTVRVYMGCVGPGVHREDCHEELRKHQDFHDAWVAWTTAQLPVGTLCE